MADGVKAGSTGTNGSTARRSQARVNVAAIERNCARLRTQLRRGVALCAVVKADGYGHGAVPSARAALAGGASWLAVADDREARELREAGLRDARVLVMGALSPVELKEALAADADVVVWNEDYLEAVAAAGGGRVHVKLDSGMGRLGTRDPAEASRVAAVARQTPGVESRRRDDPLRDRRRPQGRRVLRAPAGRLRALGGDRQGRAAGHPRPCGQQRRHDARR